MNAVTRPVFQNIQQPILPVVVINKVSDALSLAGALQEGGLHQIEITLRTPASLQALEAIAKAFPELSLSAGTIRSEEDFKQAHNAGASFFISPGFTPRLAEAAQRLALDWIPGVATASEVMQAQEAGFHTLKFFPAVAAGGSKALSGITSALQGLHIIPTGGITVDTLGPWKALPCVHAVGGTWLTTGFDGSKEACATLIQRTREALLAWENA
jgi:2-dehydro-3-deoxyphosphogluconate aldolase / (4S)-4-hydroxy-2-oxoglutarate aldolase